MSDTVSRGNMRETPKERFAGIDIVKITALILVVSVHAFLHTGFYSTPVSFQFGALQIYFRWIAFCCVPLFMTVTGYLMSRKTLTARYYKGILRVLDHWRGAVAKSAGSHQRKSDTKSGAGTDCV